MPVGQAASRSNGSRQACACCRSPPVAFLERALGDMRKVAWDRGPVRLGTYEKADGTRVPMWHDSEVAAIAFAVQNIIGRRTSRAFHRRWEVAPQAGAAPGLTPPVMAGKKCSECGATRSSAGRLRLLRSAATSGPVGEHAGAETPSVLPRRWVPGKTAPIPAPDPAWRWRY